MKRAAALAALVALACGPSANEIRRARSVAYQTEFALVWNAVLGSVLEEYPRLVDEDPVRGRLKTDWHLVERVRSEGSSGAETSQVGGRFFHMLVEIKGGPPWTVHIKGEAAEYKPGMAMIVPYKRGSADEPPWVEARIDKMYLKIFRRLEPYAIEVRQAPAEDVKKKVLDTSPWGHLPEDAAIVVAEVHAAAARKDLAALRRHMVDDFTWSEGGAPSADAALTFWSADPALLVELRKLLEVACRAAEGDPDRIVCEDRGARAEFRRWGGRWRFSAFTRRD